ncbi:MAG: putative TIGR02543 family domain protein [Streblomastix strix]|uniref:Putative TIGR02543 family domain protein n=1 Tax=Streblomastix strix TaxID=222440 RepID=A0A5J4UJA9_9EUKA|nr:MAG: putative TIGR02543 family domain protein [Streblomastix strix]
MVEFLESQKLIGIAEESDQEITQNNQNYLVTSEPLIAKYQNFIVKGLANVTYNKYISIDRNGKVYKYEGDFENEIVLIPATLKTEQPVTSIGENAFSGSEIAGIILPGTITLIDREAFANCSNLISVVFVSDDKGLNHLATIADYAFSNNSSLVSITIPNTVSKLSSTAFANCGKLQAIYIEANSYTYYTPYDTPYEGVVYQKNTSNPSIDFENAFIWPEGKSYSSIVFHLNQDPTIVYGPAGALVSSPKTIKNYYNFDGWYRDINFTQKQDILIIEDETLNLYPKWSLTNYTIIYNLKGGLNDELNPSTFTYEDEIVLYSPSRRGYDFSGWTPSGIISKNTSTNLTFVANWTLQNYNIIYNNLQGSTHTNLLSYDIESKISLTNPTSRIGYRFLGWKKDNNYLSAINPGETGEIILTAVWEAIAPTYSSKELPSSKYLSTYPNETIATAQISSGTLFYELVDGQLPIGVQLSSVGEIVGGILTQAGTYHFTVRATCYENNSFQDANFIIEVQKLEQEIAGELEILSVTSSSITLTSNLNWEYKISTNSTWQTSNIFSGLNQQTNYTFSARLAETINLNPSENLLAVSWFLIDYQIQYTNTYGIFNPNPSFYSFFDEFVFLPLPDERVGYSFSSWNKSGIVLNSTNVQIVSAFWTPNVYTIDLDYNGATDNDSLLSQEVNYELNYNLPVPTREYYSFGGWYLGSDFVTSLTNTDGSSTRLWRYLINQTAIAKWTPVEYQIKTKLGDTANSSVQIDDYRSSYTVLDAYTPPTPSRSGYIFLSWNQVVFSQNKCLEGIILSRTHIESSAPKFN